MPQPQPPTTPPRLPFITIESEDGKPNRILFPDTTLSLYIEKSELPEECRPTASALTHFILGYKREGEKPFSVGILSKIVRWKEVDEASVIIDFYGIERVHFGPLAITMPRPMVSWSRLAENNRPLRQMSKEEFRHNCDYVALCFGQFKHLLETQLGDTFSLFSSQPFMQEAIDVVERMTPETASCALNRIMNVLNHADMREMHIDITTPSLMILREDSLYVRVGLVATLLSAILSAVEGEFARYGSSTGPERERYERIKNKLPEEVRSEFEQEFAKISSGGHPAEVWKVQEHIKLMLNLYSLEPTQDNTDLRSARTTLNTTHAGLDKVKERIIGHLAVRKHSRAPQKDILCFVGPPGVGKTSFAKTIAQALGRKYTRFSLGGLRDEAEIKGHGLVYIGAEPGQIIKHIIRSGSKNPVFVLDEIDKMSKDYRGDPSSALLEVFDPEQNKNFYDLYLNAPFDLSDVFFIGTANTLTNVPPAFLDRLEVIELPGYTLSEKKLIARRHLIPKEYQEKGFPLARGEGLSPLAVNFSEGAVHKLIEEYTQEAGVRNLEREIANILRKITTSHELGELPPADEIQITAQNLHLYAGKSRIISEQRFESMPPGCVPMFAVSDHGGHFFYVEASIKRGENDRWIKVTGVRGSREEGFNNLIEESIDIALDSLTLQGGILHAREKLRRKKTGGEFYIHVHVRDGATPKDGPSAGIPMLWAMYGLLTGQSIAPNIGATGEIDLKLGTVGPVGRMRDKAVAAHRAGIKLFIIPSANESDIEDIPQEIKSQMEIKALSCVWEVLQLAFPADKRIARFLKKKASRTPKRNL